MPGVVDRVEEAVAKFEDSKGTKVKDVTTKQLVLILHKELSDKIDNHIRWGEKEDRKLVKAINDHDVLFQKIINVLPEKGFCEKVNNILWPEKPDIPLDQKVALIWHDRRWLKYIFATMVTLVVVGGGNILLYFL